MSKTKKILLIVGVVCLAVCLAVILAFCGRNNDNANDDNASVDMTYTVNIKNATGTALEGVGVYIYEDETLAELVWFDQTDADGNMYFTAPDSGNYVAVLSDLPTGYVAEEYYVLTGQLTEIVLKAGTMDDADTEELRYELGDVMMDFTIIDTEGVEYTLSELLKEKKAVVLNFWYVECAPCKMEFPYMQEAYEKYKDDIEILAMNPVNTSEEEIAAFKKELGLTFPMAKVDAIWEQIMQLTAYPTTVVIDRYGNISLIHKGSIDNADTFEQMFAYFTADEYVQRPIESLDEIVTQEEGSKDKPMQTGGGRTIDVTVGAGETYYLELYKITGKTYLTVYGEDFTLEYNGKTYSSTSGSLSITITSEGPSSPVKLALTNNTDKEQDYTISLTAPKGSLANPYAISLGKFSFKTEAGNEQGSYATYTAEKTGTLTVRCLHSNVSEFGFFLYNLDSYAMRNADEDGRRDEDGYVTVSVAVNKGDQIQFNAAVARDDNNYIAAGSFEFELMLEEGDGEEDGKIELPETTYTIQVLDQDGKPVSGVGIDFAGNFTYEPPVEDGTESGDKTGEEGEEEEPIQIEVSQKLTTNDQGIAETKQVSGPYTATVRIPDGYTLETTQYELTAENPKVTVTLKKIVMVDYTVTLTYPNGDPVEGVAIMLGNDFKYTDANGTVSFNLVEGQYSVSFVGIPEGYVLPGNVTSAAFPEGESAMTLALLAVGAQENPYEVTEFPFTVNVAAGDKIYANFYYEATPVLTIEDPDAVVTYNGTEYTANEAGILEIPMAESTSDVPVPVIIGNAGEENKSFEVQMVYPLGSIWNPENIEDLTLIEADLAEGDEDGYYFQYASADAGTLTLRVAAVAPEGTQYEVTVTTVTDGTVAVQDTDVSVYAKADETVLIYVRALPVEEAPETDEGATDGGTTDEGTTDEGTTDGGTTDEGTTDEGTTDGGTTDGGTTDEGTTDEGTTDDGTADDGNAGEGEEEVIITIPAVKLQLVGSFEIDRDAIPEGEAFYTVTVKDYTGKPMSGVMVVYKLGDTQMGAMLTDSNGMTELKLEKAVYTVDLAVTGDVKYYYEEKDAVFHTGTTSLEIKLTSVLPGEAVTDEEASVIGAAPAVSTGATYVSMQKDVVNYYVFQATEPGTYSFTTSDPSAVISYWSTPFFPSEQKDKVDTQTNSFTLSVPESMLENQFVIGVTGADDAILIITRIGEPGFSLEDVEWDTSWQSDYVPEPFTLKLTSGQSLTYVDIKNGTAKDYQLVYNEKDGFYHLGTADGPIVYVNLGFDAPYASLKLMIRGDGTAGGAALRRYYYADDGTFIKKEDYTACVDAYLDCLDETYGVYPLTKDLEYAIKNACYTWWDETHPNFMPAFEGANDDIAWLFACCYVED